MMEKHKEHESDNCLNCNKKAQLIRKYEKLLKLLKKKQQRTNSQLSSKFSNGRTTSHTSQVSHSIYHACKLYYILNNILLKRYFSFFHVSQKKSAKKYLITSIFNKARKAQLNIGFSQIKSHNSTEHLEIFQHLDQRLRFDISGSFQRIKKSVQEERKNINYFQDNKEPQELSKNIKQNLLALKENITNNKKCKNSWLSRRNMELQILNLNLQKQIGQLKLMVEEANRRLNKENEKKRQSLEMLAEELNEKNEIIAQLNGTIKMYESKYQVCNNVLDDNVFSLRKEVDHLQAVRDRVENQLTKVNKKLEISVNKSQKLEESLSKCEKQNLAIKEKLFDLETKEANTVILHSSLSKLIETLKFKQNKLKVYERQLTQSLKSGIAQKPIEFLSTSSNIISSSKAEIILCFLENINLPEYQVPSLDLFDEQQQQVLINHQLSYHKLSTQANLMSNMCTSKKKRQNNSEFQQIEFRGRNNSGTFFGAMDSPKENSERGKNLSIKLLEMELQKNKQIQKISELKQKIMHIRVIILNLLKSLQFKNLKSESQSILQILFDIFQYSEEEREEVFAPKRKKFLGFI